MKTRVPELSFLRLTARIATLLFVQWLQSLRAYGENQVDYRYMHYGEEDDRIQVDTHTAYFDLKLGETTSTHGELVYDSISGATPNGVIPELSPAKWLAPMTEIRRAGNLGLDLSTRRHKFTLTGSLSREGDYDSKGLSLGDAIDFNDKNTTLRLGVSHNFDRVLGVDPTNPNSDRPRFWTDKDSTEALIGVSQLLDKKTVLTADFTFGHESGYLNDPYRGVFFTGWLGIDNAVVMPEIRPDHRDKEVLQVGLTHFFDSANASLQSTCRLYHDSYGVTAHTVSLNWHQQYGKHFLVEPMLRFYEQSEASFYTPQGVPGFFPGDGIARPANYSADYRLSHFWSLTYGLQASVIIKENFYLDLGYHRYEMHGLDNVTSPLLYPKANIYTVGVRIWF